jgi:hypothetical protein
VKLTGRYLKFMKACRGARWKSKRPLPREDAAGMKKYLYIYGSF